MPQDKDTEILEKIEDVQQDVADIKRNLASEKSVTGADIASLKKELKEDIKKGPDNSKPLFESLFEALGLKDLFASFKDGADWGSKLLLAFGALAVLVVGQMLNFGKLFNAGLERITRTSANQATGRAEIPGKVLAVGENGLPQAMTRAQMDGLNAVSINPHGISDVQLNALKTALDGLPPKIREFNSATADMKSAGTIGKLATAVGKLKDKLDPSPEATIKDVAAAIETLHTKLAPFDHDKLPKPRTLKDIASAARDVVRDGDRLRVLFQGLATASTDAANRIAG
ncbi:hypothetical protein JHN63_24055 [Streptomyces sp. MBT65]|uniref:hypothetical protein n=1 Tax=Streptomyces sp. MBT65 TaxID=1488395 RepID=UPI00190E1E7C|nr:hypothetical protein [Streptomyces sp. MBT65]MBK3576824.1 hypothetical protein [Streptomyces sp. MBT65]